MSIADVFADAQKSVINHKSLTKRLRKIEAKHELNRVRFNEQIKQCVLRCLEVSKSEKAGANVVRFIVAYCAAMQGQEQDDEDEHSNTITNQILLILLPHMTAKVKVLRYRATQIVSQLIGIVQEIDDDLYQAIRYELILRIRDKVPAIRLEAVCALGRLLENEMDEEAQERDIDDEDDEDSFMSDEVEFAGLLRKLLDVLQNDTSADVRKALLLNLPIEPKTIPYLLERARDKDGPTRRAFYAKLMPKIGDFRGLSLSMREKLLRWGLRDRDERVRKATARMFSTLWIEQIAARPWRDNTEEPEEQEDQEEQPKKDPAGYYEPSIPALLELLERIDIVNSGEDDGVGLEAMKGFWNIRPDYFHAVEFTDEFWSDLSVESAFMARTFYEYCSHNPDALAQAEDKMPEVTRFGFHLQKYLNQVLNTRQAFEHGADIEEETLSDQEFIAEQLLYIAHTLDYTDEIGRRKMFSLFRNTLSTAELPEKMTRITVEALRLTCASDMTGEKEFIAVVTEAINEVHDTLNDDEDQTEREPSPDDNESFVSAHSELSSTSDRTATASHPHPKGPRKQLSPEEQERRELRELLTNLKCLSIAHTLLQNIVTDTSKNMALENLVNDLIVPAVRSTDAPLRERAIECLGLACLLSPTLARENRGLFIYCMRKGHEQLRQLCIKILCDIIVTWHQPSSSSHPLLQHQQQQKENQAGVSEDEEEYVLDIQPFILAMGYSSEIQQVATTCLAKLMMCGFYQGEENVVAFGTAVDEAEKGSVKGWELLAKVKAAVAADVTLAGGGAGAKVIVVEDERRQS